MSPGVLPLVPAGSIPLALLGAGLLFAAAWGAGGLLSSSRGGSRPTWVAAALRVALGLNLVALIGLLAGLPGWLAEGRSVWLLVGLSALAPIDVWRARRGRLPAPPIQPARPRRSRWRVWQLFALLPIVLTLGPALCYPTGWDELVYHNVLPRRWLAAGRPAFFADLPYSGFPSLGEILFWLVAPVESVITPRLVNWIVWLLSLVMLYQLLRRWLPRGLSLGLSGAFAVSPAVLMISANCYVEAFLLMDLAAMLLILDRGRRHGRGPLRFPAVGLGLLAGGAAAVKLTGLAILPLPFLWSIGATAGCKQWKCTLRAAVRSGAIYLATALMTALPFYLRPWIATGNPVYPYFAEVFTDDPIAIEVSRYHHAIGGSRFGIRGAMGAISAPVLLAFEGELYDGTFGWQLLAILGLAALAFAASRRTRQLAIGPLAVACLLYVSWCFTAQQARFAAPAVLAIVVVAGVGVRRLRGLVRRAALLLLVALAVVSLPWRSAGYYFGSWETVLGYWTWAEYVDDGTDRTYVPLANAIGECTPPDARLVLLFEHRTMYVPRPAVIATPFFQASGFTPPEAFADAERVTAALKRDGITHVVMTRSPIGPDHARDWSARLDPLLQSIGECVRRGAWRILWESEHYLVFEVL